MARTGELGTSFSGTGGILVGMLGFPFGSVGGMKASSLVGLPASEEKALGGGGRVLPSMESCGLCSGKVGDLDTLAALSFSLIRSATVPERRIASYWGLGEDA